MSGKRSGFIFGMVGLALLAACEASAVETPAAAVRPLPQEGRTPPSLRLDGVNPNLGNANWMSGMLAASGWMWADSPVTAPFDNNLGRFLVYLPAVFENQLPFSTTLIFDEPSFRNGLQMSGFLDRVTRELVISYIGQRRRAWYTMTHHAIIGALVARKHGLDDKTVASKWSHLLDYAAHPEVYTPVERAALRFAEAFATDPKSYTDADLQGLRKALTDHNRETYKARDAWMAQLTTARQAEAHSLGTGGTLEAARAEAQKAGGAAPGGLSDAENDRKVDQQLVELAFTAAQFIALTDVFSSLNIPDEAGMADVEVQVVQPEVIATVNALNKRGGEGLGSLIPPGVKLPVAEIRSGAVRVAPAALRGTRVRLVGWEQDPSLGTRDKGLAVGGVQVGVYGWAAGQYFPGGLGYLVVQHPEMARTEPPYSLPLLFNEDEWRDGAQTSGFVDRLLKEILVQRVYRLTRNRYGLEHHSMFLLNEYLRTYGVNPRHPQFSDAQAQEATRRATSAFSDVIFALSDPEMKAGKLSDLERASAEWTTAVVTQPHSAWRREPALRAALDRENRAQVAAGTRRLDRGPDLDEQAAFQRLVDHQVAELAMMVGHMDGLGRVLSILHTEGESSVQIARGQVMPNGRLKPELDAEGYLQPTGYFSNRPGIIEVLNAIGVPAEVLTANELLLNPKANERVLAELAAGKSPIQIDAAESLRTGEF